MRSRRSTVNITVYGRHAEPQRAQRQLMTDEWHRTIMANASAGPLRRERDCAREPAQIVPDESAASAVWTKTRTPYPIARSSTSKLD